MPVVLGALALSWHHHLIPAPLMVLSWGLLSSLFVIGGIVTVLHPGAYEKGNPTPLTSDTPSAMPKKIEAVLTDELKDRQPLFDVFMDHLPALAFIKDSQGRYLYVNSACKEMLNFSPEQMIGRTDCELWPDDTAKVICLNDAEIINGDKVFSALSSVMVDHEKRHHLVTKFGIVNEYKAPLLGGIAFDMTEKVRAEEEKANLEDQLIQSQKMEAIGTLAGGIAHDFNNVLAAIMGYVELAMFDAAPGSNVRQELDQVLKATYRATDLVRQILKFSRKTGPERKPMDLEPLVCEALQLIRASLPATIEIRHQLKADGTQVIANATQLHQVIMNICTNAAHAMEESGGVIEVGLEMTEFSGSAAGLKGVTPGRYIQISIRDTGHGIPPAVKQRIFDPYFTTKAQGKGTGMGLAVASGIVQSHKGAIDVESLPGRGTCFRILLPATSSTLEVPTDDVSSLPTGTESVLLVDDEPVLVELGKQMLERLGYKVTCCKDSRKALDIFGKDPHRFDLVITDTTMPNMTGDILATRLLKLRSDIPVLLCTGYSEQITQERASRIGIAAFLMKPLSINDMALTVRNTLDRYASHAAGRLKVVYSSS